MNEAAKTRRSAQVRERPSSFEGWPVVGWAALLVGAVAMTTLHLAGTEEAGLRAAIRGTASLSAALFLPAFIASPAQLLFLAPWTKWLLRNRRYLGLSFAVSQFTHLGFVLALAATHSASFFARLSRPTLVGGSVGYLFLTLMTATSFDRTTAWLGRRRWRLLHGTGVWLLWSIFAFTYLVAAARGSLTGLFVMPLAGGVALRVAAAVRRRRDTAASRANAVAPSASAGAITSALDTLRRDP